MSGICDVCGKDYFVSAHDLLHHATMTILTINSLLVMLPANEKYEKARTQLVSFKEYLEDEKLVKVVQTNKEA